MSNFLLNLARRGAGLAPVVTLQPPFVPPFAPDLGTAHASESEPEMASVDTATPEVPMSSATALAKMPPAEPPHRRSQERVPSSLVQPPTGTVAAQVRVSQPVKPATPQPEEASSAAVEPRTPPPHHTPKPVSLPGPSPRIEPAVQVSNDTPRSGHPPDSLRRPLEQMPPAEPAHRLPTPPDAFDRSETGPIAVPAATHTTPMPTAQEAPESEVVAQVQPATPHVADISTPIIRPAPTQPPMFPAPVELAITPSEPRSIQVRIGTIEVRATTPPSPAPLPAPTPRGFGDYALVRNYVNWDRY